MTDTPSLAERVRRFVGENYVAPMRNIPGAEIRIRTGDVHKAMRLSARMPAVCGAIDAMIFPREYGLELVRRSGPPQGANVEFVFRITKGGGDPQQAHQAQSGAAMPSIATGKLRFSLRGKTFEKEMHDFIEAMVGKVPGRVQTYSTLINGKRYPIRQVVSCATGLPSIAITSQDAYRILDKFGFPIETGEAEIAPKDDLKPSAQPDGGALSPEPETDGLFEMANLFPRTTGLPMTVWVSPRGNARHDVRVKVNMTHGNQVNVGNTAVVAVRPTPRVVAGQLSPDDQQAVFQWVQVNAAVLVAYWEGQLDTAQLIQVLKPLQVEPGAASTP